MTKVSKMPIFEAEEREKCWPLLCPFPQLYLVVCLEPSLVMFYSELPVWQVSLVASLDTYSTLSLLLLLSWPHLALPSTLAVHIEGQMRSYISKSSGISD